MGVFVSPLSTAAMPFEATSKKLDTLISSLENELGESSVRINPDDPWASYRLNTFSVSPHLQVTACKNPQCSYKLTLPFEVRCPQCDFKGENAEQFPLLSIEQMIASLPKPAPEPAPAAKKAGGNKNAKKESNNSGASNNSTSSDDLAVAWSKCNIQVSKISSVEKHPKAEKLFVIQLDAGEEAPRQVCAGLVGKYNPEDLSGRLVCTVMNLKPSKLVGVLSSAMILAGSEGDKVRVVEPPAGSSIGDRLFLEGEQVSTDTPKTLNSKFWKAVVPEFKVQDGKATIKGKVVVTSKGACSVPDLANGSEIH